MVTYREGGIVLIQLWLIRTEDGKSAAYPLLDHILTRQGISAPRFHTLPGGKPVLEGDPPPLHFNLSHSGPLVLCGIAPAPIGVDVERIRPRRPGLPRYALSEEEFFWYQSRGSRWEDFYALWTLKESRIKYTGQGLDRAARSIRVPLLSPGESAALDGLRFRSYGGEDWRAACCGEEEPPDVLLCSDPRSI